MFISIDANSFCKTVTICGLTPLGSRANMIFFGHTNNLVGLLGKFSIEIIGVGICILLIVIFLALIFLSCTIYNVSWNICMPFSIGILNRNNGKLLADIESDELRKVTVKIKGFILLELHQMRIVDLEQTNPTSPSFSSVYTCSWFDAHCLQQMESGWNQACQGASQCQRMNTLQFAQSHHEKHRSLWSLGHLHERKHQLSLSAIHFDPVMKRDPSQYQENLQQHFPVQKLRFCTSSIAHHLLLLLRLLGWARAYHYLSLLGYRELPEKHRRR